MSRLHREHPENADAHIERMIDRADMLRTERKDREMEDAMEESERRRKAEERQDQPKP